MSWIINNKEWLFSGIGVTVLIFVISKISGERNGKPTTSGTNNIDISIINQSALESKKEITSTNGEPQNPKKTKTLDDYKNETRILFIDDDARFKVAKILVNSGWLHTKLKKDCKTLDDSDIVKSELLFIDVQGVGIELGFADEGLGLALAIKQKYPNKKVIIYSAETQGNRFHEALRSADSFLPKNADPYEFQRIVEEFTIGQEQ